MNGVNACHVAEGAGVIEIEQFFADHADGEFGANSRSCPYSVIGPTGDDSIILFATKWNCLSCALDEFGPPDNIGLISRYGIPNRQDLPWLRTLVGNRRGLFLGDLDPTDLLIFAWLRANLLSTQLDHFGVNDRFLAELDVSVPSSYTIELSDAEVEACRLLDKALPNLDKLLGPECLSQLRRGRKIEQEAVISTIGSATPILKLLASRVR